MPNNRKKKNNNHNNKKNKNRNKNKNHQQNHQNTKQHEQNVTNVIDGADGVAMALTPPTPPTHDDHQNERKSDVGEQCITSGPTILEVSESSSSIEVIDSQPVVMEVDDCLESQIEVSSEIAEEGVIIEEQPQITPSQSQIEVDITEGNEEGVVIEEEPQITPSQSQIEFAEEITESNEEGVIIEEQPPITPDPSQSHIEVALEIEEQPSIEGDKIIESSEEKFTNITITPSESEEESNQKAQEIKAKRIQNRLELESHFFPQLQNPRFLESISEENSDSSDVERKPEKKEPQTPQSPKPQMKHANVAFPKPNAELSKRRKHLRQEETIPLIVETKILHEMPVEEQSGYWDTELAPSLENAEIMYISGSSSASDLASCSDCDSESMDAEDTRIETPIIDVNANRNIYRNDIISTAENLDDILLDSSMMTMGGCSPFADPPSTTTNTKIMKTCSEDEQTTLSDEKNLLIREDVEPNTAENSNNDFESMENENTSSVRRILKLSEISRERSFESTYSEDSQTSQCTAIHTGIQSPPICDFGDSNKIKQLKLLCIEKLMAMPYGNLVIDELALSAENLEYLLHQQEQHSRHLESLIEQGKSQFERYMREKSITPPPVPPPPVSGYFSKEQQPITSNTEGKDRVDSQVNPVEEKQPRLLNIMLEEKSEPRPPPTPKERVQKLDTFCSQIKPVIPAFFKNFESSILKNTENASRLHAIEESERQMMSFEKLTTKTSRSSDTKPKALECAEDERNMNENTTATKDFLNNEIFKDFDNLSKMLKGETTFPVKEEISIVREFPKNPREEIAKARAEFLNLNKPENRNSFHSSRLIERPSEIKRHTVHESSESYSSKEHFIPIRKADGVSNLTSFPITSRKVEGFSSISDVEGKGRVFEQYSSTSDSEHKEHIVKIQKQVVPPEVPTRKIESDVREHTVQLQTETVPPEVPVRKVESTSEHKEHIVKIQKEVSPPEIPTRKVESDHQEHILKIQKEIAPPEVPARKEQKLQMSSFFKNGHDSPPELPERDYFGAEQVEKKVQFQSVTYDKNNNAEKDEVPPEVPKRESLGFFKEDKSSQLFKEVTLEDEKKETVPITTKFSSFFKKSEKKEDVMKEVSLEDELSSKPSFFGQRKREDSISPPDVPLPPIPVAPKREFVIPPAPPVPDVPIIPEVPPPPRREYQIPVGIVTSPTSPPPPVIHRPPEVPVPPFPEAPKREHVIPIAREFSPYENIGSPYTRESRSPRPVSERTAFHSELEALVGKQAKEKNGEQNHTVIREEGLERKTKEHFVTVTREETTTKESTTTKETTVPISTFIPDEYRLPKAEPKNITETVKELKIPVVKNLPTEREELLKAFNEKLNELKELSKTVFQRSCSVEPSSEGPEKINRYARHQSVDRHDHISQINKDFENFLQNQQLKPARRFLSCQNLGESLEQEGRSLNGSSENIAKPIMKEVNICESRQAGKIRAPRLSTSSMDVSSGYHPHYHQSGRLPTYMSRAHSTMNVSKTTDTRRNSDIPNFSLYSQPQSGRLPTYMSRPHSTSFQGLKQKYHAPIAEDPLMNQHMAEEWLDKIAEREERRLQKIIKISQLKNEAKSNRKTAFEENTNIGEEFLKKAKERRRRFCGQSDSDRESGTDARGSETDEPSVKITDDKLRKTRHLPQHLRDFVEITKEFKKEENTEEAGRYQYKSSGYQSEPEGYHYDSDYYTMSNKPLDRRRTVWPPAKETDQNQRSLLEQGYESDTNLIFHKKQIEENDLDKYLNDYEKRQSYKRMQVGGEPPLLGFRKPAPEKPKELGDSASEQVDGKENGDRVSPTRYIETDVNIHYKSPVRFECKELISEDELAYRQAERMKKIYEQEKYDKYIRQLQDINSRRHTDHFMSSQKSPIPLNRYDDFNSEYICIKSPVLIPPNTISKALYDFKGQSLRELSFKKGDYIILRRQIDNNWFEGEHNARVGLLPIKYVEVMTKELGRRPKTPSEGQARAKYNFNAQTALELSLNKGELVTLTRRVDANWFEGKIANRKGIFPVNYVEVLTDIGAEDKLTKSIAEYSATVSATARNNYNNNNIIPIDSIKETKTVSHSKVLHVDTEHEPVLYRALYKYRPQNNDELELKEGDLVFVLEICDDGWYVGTSQRTGCFGTFPGNYVQIVRD